MNINGKISFIMKMYKWFSNGINEFQGFENCYKLNTHLVIHGESELKKNLHAVSGW